MRQQIHAPVLCLFFVFCLFTCSISTAKTQDKVITTTTHTSLIASTNSFAAKANETLPVSTGTIEHETDAVNSNKTEFIKGLFYGAFGIMLLLNLISFLLFEEKAFGYYGLAITGTLMLFFGEDNLPLLLFGNSITNTTALATTLLCASVGFIALFSSQFLTIKEFYPKLKSFTIPLFVFAAGLAISSWILGSTMLSIAANIISFTVLICYFGAGIALFSKNNYSKFYVIGFSIPLLFVFDYFLLQSLDINFLNTSLFHVKGAFFINILLMTYAILFRMKAIKEETVLRKTEMQIFLKRQEMMNRDNIARMMEDVYLENLIMHYDLDGVEIKLLQYISEGKENKKIARKLNTTELDIEEMTRDLYHKLQISEAIQEDVTLLDTQPDYIYN
jgi:DNA-binding CsgD family transcriptional regulator